MSEHHESTKCANGTESKQSIEIVSNILRQAKNTLPADRYAKFEEEVRQTHEDFLNKKNLAKEACRDNVTELKKDLTKKLRIQEEEEVQKREIMEAKKSCSDNKFKPGNEKGEGINGKKTAKYFTYLIAHPEEINELNSKFAGNPKLLAGFLHYWQIQNIPGKVNPESNIIHILGPNNAVVRWMNEYYDNLIKGYKIEISSDDSVKDVEDKIVKGKKNNSGEQGSIIQGLNYIKSKATNIVSEQLAKNKLGLSTGEGFSDKGLLGFSNEKGGNYFISMQEFETELKTKDIHDINSLGLANYFKYLDFNKQLTPEILIQKFNNNSLVQLGQLWGKSGTESDPNRLIAKKILEKSKSKYIIDVITTINSPGDFFNKIKTFDSKSLELTLSLLSEKGTKLRRTIIEELQPQFEKNKSLKKEQITTTIDEMLSEMSETRGMQGILKMYKICYKYEKKYGIKFDIHGITEKVQEVKENTIKEKYVQAKLKGPQDPKSKQYLQELEKEGKEEKQVMYITTHITDEKEIKRIITGETTVEQVVTRLQKEDKEFAKEYATWEKEKEQTPQKDITSKGEKENISSSAKGNTESIQGINKDNPKQEIIFSGNTTADIQWIPGGKYQMTLAIGGENETVTLSKKELIGYTESFQFLGDMGLGYLVKNIHPTKLSELIKATSRNGDIIDNSDGDFTSHEKMKLLISFGEIFDIDMKQVTDIETAEKVFKSALRQGISDINQGFQKIAEDTGFLSDGAFNLMKFETAIKPI